MLVNAGHSPSSLARQMVRYLRNTLMAKLGGEQTELLQISGDERARAARTALLFTEEEITRNLQIVLRTFDDLNYRQEQRFHLELGLLKLIHAQRLLPIEELLSGAASAAGALHPRRSALLCRRTALRARKPHRRQRPPSLPSRPAAWNSSPTPKQSTSPWPRRRRRPSPHSAQRDPAPFPAASSQPLSYGTTATLTEGALAKAPEADGRPILGPSLHRRPPPRHRQRPRQCRPPVRRATARRLHLAA